MDDSKRKLCDMEEIDEKVIENKPWANRLLMNSIDITKKAVLNWCNTVSKIGDTELDVEEYVTVFLQQMEALYEDLIMDVDALQQKSLHKIVTLLEQMQHLCRDLHLDMPTFNYEGVPLCELRQIIVQRVEQYQSQAEIRRKELQELQRKQIKLCKSLGQEPNLLPESPLPLPSEIENLRTHVEALENEAMEREERFFQVREQILELVEELQVAPSLDFEKEILSLGNTEVKITDNDMDQLEQYHDRLVRQFTSVKEEILELRHKVDDLWDKLETDIAERCVFRENNTGNSLKTQHALKDEVRRLEDQKKANIKVFIQKQRQELTSLWEKCHCTESEKKLFAFFHSEYYNEDLFELHEREIEKWKSFYAENEEIFQLLGEHKNLWFQLMDLDFNSGGANRYKNRGGQLLVEEKLRNKLRKRIPKIEQDLNRLSEAYLGRKGVPFKSFGKTVEEYISQLHEDREKEFKLKLSAKKQQREQASVVGGSRMNLFPSSASTLNPTLTPRSCAKRKIITTPVTEPAKKMIKTVIQKRNSRSGLPRLNVSKTRRRSKNKNKSNKRLSFTKPKTNSDKENANDTASTSYADFEEDITTKKFNCRSTGFVLKDSNQIKMTVAPATPVKKTESKSVFRTPLLKNTPRPLPKPNKKPGF